MTQSHVELIDKSGKTVGRQPARKILKWYASAQGPTGYSVRTESGPVPIAEWVERHQTPPELPTQPMEAATVQPSLLKQRKPVIAIACAVLASLAIMVAAVAEVISLRRQIQELQVLVDSDSRAIAETVTRPELEMMAIGINQKIRAQSDEALRKAEDQIDDTFSRFNPFMFETTRALKSLSESAQMSLNAAVSQRDRILALERRFGLAPDPNPHPKEAFKARGLPGPDLEEKDKK